MELATAVYSRLLGIKKREAWGGEIESTMSVIPPKEGSRAAKARSQGGTNQKRRVSGGVEWQQRIRCPVYRARWERQRRSRDGTSPQRCCLSFWGYSQSSNPV